MFLHIPILPATVTSRLPRRDPADESDQEPLEPGREDSAQHSETEREEAGE